MGTDTIAAIATAMTNAGISIIRISGEDAVAVADRIVHLKSNKTLAMCKTHTIHYGYVENNGEILDEVMVLLMRGPKSYTREDTVEIDCHGGILVTKRILELVIANGARPAEPGEFTKRAFLNGRIDLSQAESVIDVINAKNDFALKASVDQLQGSVSSVIRAIREKVLHEIAFIESAIDDPEHYDLEHYGEDLEQKVDALSEEISHLLRNAENGSVLKEGIRTVIVGKPNSGKSSLMNTLLGKERAIVTDIAGTTRDILEEQVRLSDITLNVIDTAGIRSTDDLVEKIGVDKAKEYMENSDLVIYMVDASVPLDENDEEIMGAIQNKNVIVLLNKSDLEAVITEDILRQKLDKPVISISAKFGNGMADLQQLIEKMFFQGTIQSNDEIYITNIRHKNALQEAKNSLMMVKESIRQGMPEDFYSIDLMNCYEVLGKILGESVEDDLVNEIFSKFCMGK